MREPTYYFPTRRIIAILAVLYLCFVVYGSLVPLKFVGMPIDKALAAFSDIPFLNLGADSRADWVANLLLFIPLSFLCNDLATHGKTRSWRYLISLMVLLFTVGLAFTLEFTQLFFPQRTVSQNDIWAESLGSIIGITGQLRFGGVFEAWLEALWRKETRLSRLTRALNVYLLALLTFNVLPLDLTLSPVELYHKWSEGRIVLFPFSGLKGALAEKIYETLTDILIWIPAGLLWSLAAKRTAWRTAAWGLISAGVIELAQLFVYSRVTDITDILLAGVGVLIGAQLAQRITAETMRTAPSRALWMFAWALWAAIMLTIFWFPFDFDAARFTLSRTQGSLTHPLLTNYYFGSEFRATNELLRKVGFFIPGGALCVAMSHRAGTLRSPRWLFCTALITALALLIEAGQLLLPSKYADLTDVLIMTAGGILGMQLARWILSGQDATAGEIERIPDAPPIPLRPHPGRTDRHRLAARYPYVAAFAILASAIGVLARLPSTPYNLRELVAPGGLGLFSIAGLSLCILWQIAGHNLYLRYSNRHYGQAIFLPLWLLAHGATSWLLLRLAVPLESLHDILGAPVLNWFGESELIVRFIVLNSAIAMPLIGAIILVSVAIQQSRTELLISWIVWALTLAWPLHWGIVVNAATDNLTELMREGGSLIASLLLAGGLFTFALAGNCVACSLSARTRLVPTLAVTAAALLGSAVCLWVGTEQIIVRYGKVFSAWQFLLSTDRDHYASGTTLLVRFAIAYGAALTVFSAIQTTFWKSTTSRP